MDNDLQLLDDLLVQSDEAMAAIQRGIELDMPPADHPMWASMARQKAVKAETPTNSILNAAVTTQAPVAYCMCQANDLPQLKQQPRIDLDAGVVRCQRCDCVVPKSPSTKQVRWMRGLIQTYSNQPNNIDIKQLQELDVIYAG